MAKNKAGEVRYVILVSTCGTVHVNLDVKSPFQVGLDHEAVTGKSSLCEKPGFMRIGSHGEGGGPELGLREQSSSKVCRSISRLFYVLNINSTKAE